MAQKILGISGDCSPPELGQLRDDLLLALGQAIAPEQAPLPPALEFAIRDGIVHPNNDTNVWGDFTRLISLSVRPKAEPNATGNNNSSTIYLLYAEKCNTLEQIPEKDAESYMIEAYKKQFAPKFLP